MKIVVFFNTAYSHVVGGLQIIAPLIQENEVHVFVEKRFENLITDNRIVVHFYNDECSKKSRKIMEEYPEYTGGIGSACKQENDISGYKKEIISMLDYSLRASKGYFEDLILIVKRIDPDLIIRDSCAIFGRMIADYLKIPVYGYCTSPVLTEKEIQHNKRIYLELISNWNLDKYNDSEIDNLYFDIRKDFEEKCRYYGIRILPTDYLINPDEEKNISYSLPFENIKDGRYYYFKPFIFSKLDIEEKKEYAYVSAGTVVNFPIYVYNAILNSLPKRYKKTIITLKYIDTGIIKTNHIPNNVEIVPFVNQKDILQKSKLFITHAGYNSLLEGIYYKVPMIAIPLSNDQFLNAYFFQKNKVCISTKKENLKFGKEIFNLLDNMPNLDGFDHLIKQFNELPDISKIEELL